MWCLDDVVCMPATRLYSTEKGKDWKKPKEDKGDRFGRDKKGKEKKKKKKQARKDGGDGFKERQHQRLGVSDQLT